MGKSLSFNMWNTSQPTHYKATETSFEYDFQGFQGSTGLKGQKGQKGDTFSTDVKGEILSKLMFHLLAKH